MPKSKVKKLNIIDLFAGCGGLTEGFESIHLFDTLACIEWDESSALTLAKRLKERWNYSDADKRVLRFDVQRTKELFSGWNDKEFGVGVGLDKLVDQNGNGRVDLIVGGPPCQAYSIAGRIRDENGMEDDYRNFLFEKYIEIVSHFNPKIIVFENVPGMLSATPGGVSIVERIHERFDKAGYEVIDDFRKYAIVDAADYGVPQYRKRLVIVGLAKDFFPGNRQEILKEFYLNILPSLRTDKKITVADAISDLPKIKKGEQVKESKIKNHVPRNHSERDSKIFKELALDVLRDKRKYASVAAIRELYTERTGKTSSVHKYHVLESNKPSSTIVAHLHKDGLRHIHPDPSQARSITVREAARLQSFPDDFEFMGSMGDQYKMVGNAVPPKLAEAIARSVAQLLVKHIQNPTYATILQQGLYTPTERPGTRLS